jgi:hydroxymethylpyrimidine/phosphomethylpyrimidine kinase
MSKKLTYILSIAGFDPCGGAGVLADVKTFEQHGCTGMAVQTANTIQTESEFKSVNWIDESIVFTQLDFLLSSYQFKYVKIGLIPSLTFFKTVVEKCKTANRKVKIIWDPVLSASSGFSFGQDLSDLKEILNELYLITPNWSEVQTLSSSENGKEGAKILSEYVKVYLKGGHNPDDLGKDFLFENSESQTFNPKARNMTYYEKHGSGCVLSSAIAANLANGYLLQKSCLKSKRYIEGVLASSKTFLGRHKL